MQALPAHREPAAMPYPPRPAALRPPANGHRHPVSAMAARQRGVALFVVIIFVMLAGYSRLSAFFSKSTSPVFAFIKIAASAVRPSTLSGKGAAAKATVVCTNNTIKKRRRASAPLGTSYTSPVSRRNSSRQIPNSRGCSRRFRQTSDAGYDSRCSRRAPKRRRTAAPCRRWSAACRQRPC